MRVHVVCRNLKEDRVLPRFSRYLAEGLGWTVTAAPEPGYDAYYLSGYFEAQLIKEWPRVPVGAYFTHREEEPPGNAKAKLFDSVGRRVDLRVVTAGTYARQLAEFGATVQVHPPVERDRFVPPTPALPRGGPQGREIRAGFSGYTYRNGRKGEGLAAAIVASEAGRTLTWMASGRGWPVPTKRYAWKQMPAFYQALDILVCTALVEGVPMPPLEALACGVSVVVPRGVGLLDELPEVLGIHRYERGDAVSLERALAEAVETRPDVDREALRAVTEPYTVAAWCAEHARAFAEAFGQGAGWYSIAQPKAHGMGYTPPKRRTAKGPRGIYTVAFGEPARAAALDLIATIRTHMPDIPIAVTAATPLGVEDVHIEQPDSDIGARRAKIRMYELAPAEWESVLYLDADTELVAPLYPYFEWVEDGWELVITKDPHTVDTLQSYARPNNAEDMARTKRTLGSLDSLQLAGGVMAFGRSERIRAFFDAWLAEYEVHCQRDQGPLVRALYRHPLRTWVLGSQWNTFPRYLPREQSAGLIHYPGKARRWSGMVPGRTDSDAAWAMVEQHTVQQAARRRRI